MSVWTAACKIVNLLPPAPPAQSLAPSFKWPNIVCSLKFYEQLWRLPNMGTGTGFWIRLGVILETQNKSRAVQRGAKRLTRGLHSYWCSFRLGFYLYSIWKTFFFVHFKQVCLPLSLLRVFLFTAVMGSTWSLVAPVEMLPQRSLSCRSLSFVIFKVNHWLMINNTRCARW